MSNETKLIKLFINHLNFKIMAASVFFITFFGTIFGIYYLFLINRHKERMALIEKGASADFFNSEKTKVIFNWSWSKLTMKIGMLAIGIALGLFSALLLDIYSSELFPVANFKHFDEIFYPTMIFFFGGLSLVIFYIVDRKNKKD